VQTDCIILGQGICGTLLSFELYKAGKSFIVIDNANPGASSRIASGLINPVTGKRHVTSWKYDEFNPVALNTYHELEKELDCSLIRSCSMVNFHNSIEEKDVFRERVKAGNPYLQETQKDWSADFNYYFGVGIIDPCWLIDVDILLGKWKNRLESVKSLWTEQFEWNNLSLKENKIIYKDIEASCLICCEGPAAVHNPIFSLLPFSMNKGEMMLIRIPGLSADYIYRQQLKIIPLEEDLFWAGASFEWKYNDVLPGEAFYKKTETQLRSWLKLPFTIEAHYAAERPSSVDYKPFVGFHPLYPRVGILNGMGTKGYLQAPFFAKQIVTYLYDNMPILADADVKRYNKLLSNRLT